MVLIPEDLGYYSQPHARSWSGNLPGHPNCGPHLHVEEARRLEEERSLADPIGARDWDLKADARQQAWETGPFAKAYDQLSPGRGQ